MKGLEKLKTLDQLVAPKAKKLKVQPSIIKSMYTDQQKFDLLWNQILKKVSTCEKNHNTDTLVQYYFIDLNIFKQYALNAFELQLDNSMIDVYNKFSKDYIEKSLDDRYSNEVFLLNHRYLKINGQIKNDLSSSEKLKSEKFISRCEELSIDLKSKVLILNGKKDLNLIDKVITEKIGPYLKFWEKAMLASEIAKDTYAPFKDYFFRISNRAYNDKHYLTITHKLDQRINSDLYWKLKREYSNIFWKSFEVKERYESTLSNLSFVPDVYDLEIFKEFQIGNTVESYIETFLRFIQYVDTYFTKENFDKFFGENQ